jgi:hypothetical protein
MLFFRLGIVMRGLVGLASAALFCVLVAAGFAPASADVLINVSKTSQRVAVMVDGTAKYNWPVSTGRGKRYMTPSGVYKPEWLARMWRSKQYHNSPMPHSVFFHEGYALHGTNEVRNLGHEASHGCVRLSPANAATLYALVQKNMTSTRIVVSDDTIDKPSDTPKKKPGQFVAENGAAPVTPKLALEALALAPETATPEKPRAAEKREAREARAAEKQEVREPRIVEKREAREPREKVARAERSPRPGFHW